MWLTTHAVDNLCGLASLIMRTEQIDEQHLRLQIEATAAQLFSTDDIESRIAAGLVRDGEFHEDITAAELEVILYNIVYVMFAQQTVAGVGVGILHNVVSLQVEIKDHQAFVEFVVHIHKPVVVFLEFSYILINDADSKLPGITLKNGSLIVQEKTRRFDIKAKAALTAMNVPRIARNEMSDLTEVIRRTLPAQLNQKHVTGKIDNIELMLNNDKLRVRLEGAFTMMPVPTQ